MTEKVYDGHHGLILKCRDQKLKSKGKFKFIPIMPCKKCTSNFKKGHFEENYKNWLFSNHCLMCLVVLSDYQN